MRIGAGPTLRQPLRYIAVDRDALRALLFDDGPLSDLVLSTFISRREALQRVQGIGLEIVGPRSSDPTMRLLDFARANRLPFTWHETGPPREAEPPLVRLPGGNRSIQKLRSLVAGNLGGEARASTGCAFETEAPAERLDPIGEADESRAGARFRTSDAIVADDDSGDPV